MIKYIFFDFDGTISDARIIAYQSLVKTLEEFGYSFDKKKASKLLGIRMEKILKSLGIIPKDLEKVRKKFYYYLTKSALKGGIKPCVSLKPLFKLKKTHPLIVVSNSETHFLIASIKKLKIRRLFNEVYGADKFKTKDKMLENLFRKFKIKPKEAVYIGDRFSDIKFARKAGCIAVAVHNKCSWSSLNEIKKEKPDYIVKNFYELQNLIKT